MSVWKELKKEFNERKFLPLDEIYNKYSKEVHSHTVHRYIGLLYNCECIEFHNEGKTGEYIKHYYKDLRKIPDDLTIKEATTMQYMAWLLWFKYPDVKEN